MRDPICRRCGGDLTPIPGGGWVCEDCNPTALGRLAFIRREDRRLGEPVDVRNGIRRRNSDLVDFGGGRFAEEEESIQ